MSSENKEIEYVPPDDERYVSRNLVKWLNTFPDIPIPIDLVDYDYLAPGTVCMTLSTIQSTYKIDSFINDIYIADYQFKIAYRVKPKSPDARLSADELLSNLAKWAVYSVKIGQGPDIGEGLKVETLEQTANPPSLFARLEDGWEDHQIFMRMTYKVIPRK